jgi:hypothetical protein
MRKNQVGLAVVAVVSILGMPGSGLRAQTVVTYQGRMLANGTAFDGVGQFKFALVTGTNLNKTATAKANISGGFVTTYDVTFGGSGYTSPAAVTVSGGGGSGATARASVAGGIVTSVVAESPGAGYTSAPSVLIAPPPPNISYKTHWSNDGTSSAGSEPTAGVSIDVRNGLFTVPLGDTTLPNMTALDAVLFTRSSLQLRIWFSDGTAGFVVLDPAQNLTHAPYAAVAQSASSVAGGLQVQSNTNGAPNLVGGSLANFVAPGVYGATIAGGGAEYYPGSVASNQVTAIFGTVGGGVGNAVSGEYGTVGGGYVNQASGVYATVSGGSVNLADGLLATVAGGSGNAALGAWATVSGGNTARSTT